MVYQDNRIITLNSQDGEKLNGTYLSNIHFNFSGLLKEEPSLIRSYVTVLNAQIPVSFYIIDETNNVLKYLQNYVSKTITLNVGNYNGNQMVSTLNASFIANGSSVTVSLNSSTGILTFIPGAGGPYGFSSTSTIKGILGFSEDISSTFFPIIMPYQLNLLGKKKIFINSNK